MQTRGLSMEQNNRLLDRLITATIKTVERIRTQGGRDKWPLPKCHIWDCDIYYMAYLLERLYDYFKEAEEHRWSYEEIAKIYWSPTFVARLLFLFSVRPLTRLTQQQIIELGYKIARVLNVFYKDKFDASLTRKNLIWSRSELNKYIKKVKIKAMPKSDEEKTYHKLLNQIEGKFYLYLELAYNDLPDSGYEIHGPYELGHSRVLVREYYNLQPRIWRFSRTFPLKHVTILETFKTLVKVGIDMHCRFYSSKPLSPYVNKFSVVVDGKDWSDINSLTKLSNLLDEYLKKGAMEKSKATKKEIVEKFSFSRAMLTKPLADALGKDWRPPKKVLKKIKKQYLTKKERKYLKFLLSPRMGLKERFDPRVPISYG